MHLLMNVVYYFVQGEQRIYVLSMREISDFLQIIVDDPSLKLQKKIVQRIHT